MTDRVASSDGTDERLLFLLKSRGPLTAQGVARQLGVSVVAARKQLDRLLQATLVRFEEQRGSVGRPQRIWHLTDRGHGRFPDGHSHLTLDLIGSVRNLFGDEGLDRLIADRERATREKYHAALAGTEALGRRVAILARLRGEEGYMAEHRKLPGGAYLLVENHCPICAAATTCQGLCRSELALFRAVLGLKVRVTRTEHLLAGGRRCTYRIEAAGDD